MKLEAGMKLGRYEVVEPLGAGGMGEVYRARDPRLDRDVALKVLARPLVGNPQALARFQREARAVAALSHPNVLTIHDTGSAGDVAYLVTEYLVGRTLRDGLGEGGLALATLVPIAVAVVEGLVAAHAKGIVHRDIKPENVFLTADGGVKILDFGLARLRSDDLAERTAPSDGTRTLETSAGALLGTVDYMSPEQVRGQQVDFRSDLFSFGCVLFEMADGRRPFARGTMPDTMAAILNESLPPLPGVPDALNTIVARCTAKQPGDRFGTTADLAAALKALQPSGAGPGASGEQAAPQDQGIRSLAVLPLVNMSGNPEQEFFADGMTEALIADLAQIGSLRLISRTSVMRYKNTDKPLPEIARELDVDALLEGSVIRAGDRVRVTAQLIDAGDTHLWGGRYDHDARDVLALQSEVARAVAREIEAVVTPLERARLERATSIDPAAHEAYLMGRHQWNKRTEQGFVGSIRSFNRAIDLNPDYALAHAGLADTYALMGNFGLRAPKDVYPLARRAAERALELDGRLAAAHASLAFVLSNFEWDFAGAEAEYREAIELNPSYATAHHWYAYHLTAMGRHDEAIPEIQMARRLDPLSSIINGFAGWLLYLARRYDEARTELRRADEIDPQFGSLSYFMGVTLEAEGRYAEAATMLERSAGQDDTPERLAAIAHAHARAGHEAEARRVLAELERRSGERYVSAFDLGLVHLGLGETDRAFEFFDRAVDERAYWLVLAGVDPRLDPLRDDGRFKALLERVGLVG